MAEAALWAFFGAASLLVGMELAFVFHAGRRTIGLMAFGAGAMISAVSFELVEEALKAGKPSVATTGLAAGAVVFFAGDVLIARPGRRVPEAIHRGTGRGFALLEISLRLLRILIGIAAIVWGLADAGRPFMTGRRRGWASLLRGLASMAFGLALIFWPDPTVAAISILLGILLLVWGLIEIAASVALRPVSEPSR
jgi:uncharacterized membrane protein HdeD (DUF308 family)